MSDIGGMQLSGVLRAADYDDIRSAAETAECELIDATRVETFSTQLVDVVRDAIERNPGPRLRVAVVAGLDAWALFGGKQNSGVPALRMFHGAQLDSFAVQRWIRAGTEPDADLPHVLADLERWLGGPWSTAIVNGVARHVRKAPAADRERYLAQLVEVAHGYVSQAELESIEREARMDGVPPGPA